MNAQTIERTARATDAGARLAALTRSSRALITCVRCGATRQACGLCDTDHGCRICGMKP